MLNTQSSFSNHQHSWDRKYSTFQVQRQALSSACFARFTFIRNVITCTGRRDIRAKVDSMIDSSVIIELQMLSYDQMKKQIQRKTVLQFLWTSIWILHIHTDFQNSGKIKVMWSQVFKYTWLYCLIALLSIISSSGHATCAKPSSWFISQTSNQFHCPLWNQLYWNQPT